MLEENKFYNDKDRKRDLPYLGNSKLSNLEASKFIYYFCNNELEYMGELHIPNKDLFVEGNSVRMDKNITVAHSFHYKGKKDIMAFARFDEFKKIYDNALEKSLEAQN